MAKEFLIIGEHLTMLQAKWLIISCATFALHFFVLKDADLAKEVE